MRRVLHATATSFRHRATRERKRRNGSNGAPIDVILAEEILHHGSAINFQITKTVLNRSGFATFAKKKKRKKKKEKKERSASFNERTFD